MRRLQVTLLMGLCLVGVNLGIAADFNYAWCERRIEHLDEQIKRAMDNNQQDRVIRLERKAAETNYRCGVGPKPEMGEGKIIIKEVIVKSDKDQVIERRIELEKEVLKQKQQLSKVSSALKIAEKQGDHLQVQVKQIELEHEKEVLELLEEDLKKYQ